MQDYEGEDGGKERGRGRVLKKMGGGKKKKVVCDDGFFYRVPFCWKVFAVRWHRSGGGGGKLEEAMEEVVCFQPSNCLMGNHNVASFSFIFPRFSRGECAKVVW